MAGLLIYDHMQALCNQMKGHTIMKTSKTIRCGSILLSLIVMILLLPTSILAAQAPVNLGTTSGFAVLAGTTITNIGTTAINGEVGGNVGLYPGTNFAGQETATISGAVHINDAVASKAKDDLVAAYDDAAGRTPVTRISSELGGATLKPGTYDSSDGTFQITGTLTLDAEGDPDGVFVFLTSSTLITASDSSISLLNSARFCRIFWKVGSSATLGTNSHFVGHILALTSISAQTGATVQGQLLARNGAVTLDSNTITNGFCENAVIPTPGIIEGIAAGATPAVTSVVTPPATPGTTVPTTTNQTVTPTGESSTNILIGLIMIGLAGSLLLVLKRTRRQTGTVIQNSDYRIPNPRK